MGKLRPQEARFLRKLFDHTAEAVMLTDAAARIVHVNRSFTDVTGYPLGEVCGKTPRILHSGRQGTAFYARMWKSLNAAGRWQGEIWNRRKNGEVYPEWLSITAVRNRAGAAESYLAIFSDITVRKRAERRLYRLATHDVLTGLPNRLLLGERLRHAIAHARRAGHLVALVYLDLDGFKAVNDRIGHRCGDLLLQGVARRLKRSMREEDTVARIGGDEFAVVLEDLSGPADAAAAATKLLQAVARSFSLNAHKAMVTASIGISLYPFDGADPDTLVRRADSAMYRAKAKRRNSFRFSARALRMAGHRSRSGEGSDRRRKAAARGAGP